MERLDGGDMTQLSLSNVAVEFGATKLFSDITFTIAARERWGIIGRNGTGKTTLFKLITGDMQPSRGVIARQPALRVALLEQHRDFGNAKTVWEAAAGQFAELLALEQSLADQATKMGELGESVSEQVLSRYAHDLERFEREGGYTIAPRVDAVLHGLGFDPVDARTRPLERLSGGERGRVGLARQLVAPADVLLLDEPTNHLDLETTRWLEEYLKSTDETVVLISHDRAFLENVADHILHLEAHSATAYVGGYTAFVEQRAHRQLEQQRAFVQQKKTIDKQEDYIRRHLAGQNSRQAKGRRKILARLPRLSPPPGEEDTMSLRLESGERGGDQVAVAEKLRLAVGDRVLVENFSAVVQRGDVIGFIGPNGAGKSTLLRALVGDRTTEGGEIRLGGSITPAYYRQDLTQVPSDQSLYDVINDLRPMWGRGAIQGHLGRFGFSGDSVQRSAATLSGGERARVALAMIMLSRANLLLLDEPTNHLDVESIEALEDAVERYDGTVFLVSHDRALLRALANRVWILHDRHITDFDGSFAEWETASAEREHAASVAASEEQESRRVRERQKTRTSAKNGKKESAPRRRTREEIADAEAEVARREARVAELTKMLADPELYNSGNGGKKAASLGAELEREKEKLERAFAEWERAIATE
ncbi:MAG TPA: ABC-F family ATP-binding cassette domain-containing protein [Gemmatimonadaceae bacterium]|nr:ABC-F family ATP-binding cassette domain-containing protein [Gemmatimonadaceae bacterium]